MLRSWSRADVFDYIARFHYPRRLHSKLSYLGAMEFEARAMLAKPAVHETDSCSLGLFAANDWSYRRRLMQIREYEF
jgi:hypothetical protein